MEAQKREILFILWVDNFGIKYVNKNDALHLQQALGKLYWFEINWTEKMYVR